MKAIVGAEIRDQDRFATWLPVLQAWAACHVEFAQQVDDAAYWYTERSNVGILAQAAWRAGRVALEEYQAKKSRQHGRATKEWLGRCDLWLSDAQGGELIEAKQEYLALRSRQAVFLTNKILASAVKDAGHTRNGIDSAACGIAFLPVYLRASCAPTAARLADDILALIDALRASDAGMMAWSFPAETREYLGTDGRNLIPGIILLGASAPA